MVLRPGLVEMLRAAGDARLLLVRAPTGYGKTTLLQQLRAELLRSGVTTAWLTLRAADNDEQLLSRSLGAVLASALPAQGCASAAATLLGRLPEGFVLLIDELQELHGEAAEALVKPLLYGLPSRGRLVLGCRGVPALGLGRLRAQGHLFELGAKDLLLSPSEARQLLDLHAPGLAEADVQLLYHKTEGWAAALRLAAAGLQRYPAPTDFVQRFSGATAQVAEYLAEDVFMPLPPPQRDFLLRTSVLRHLEPALCERLMSGADARVMLEDLVRRDVPLLRDGDDGPWRHHRLFGEFLQLRLEREQPRQSRTLHAAALTWFSERGQPVQAIDHAIAAGDTATALALMELHARTLLEAGRLRLLMRWFDAMPEVDLSTHPALQAVMLWALCCTRGPQPALERLRGSSLERSDDVTVRPHLLAMRPMLLALMDRTEDAYAAGQVALRRLPSGDTFADGVLLASMAELCSAMDLPAQATELLDRYRSMHAGSAAALNDMQLQTVEGMIAYFDGRMREAGARFRTAVTATQPVRRDVAGGNAWAGVLHAAALYEADARTEVSALLGVYLPLARNAGLPDHVTMGCRMLARIAFDAGDIDRAFELMAELESFGFERQLARVVASARLERSRLQLLQGHHRAARDELARASDQAIWTPIAHLRLLANDVDYPRLALLRWEIHTGHSVQALPSLEREIDMALNTRRGHRALKLRLLQAIALARSSDGTQAQRKMTEVLRDAWTEDFRRLVLDEGVAAGQLTALVFRSIEGSSEAGEPAFVIWLQRLLEAFGPMPAERPTDVPSIALQAYLKDPLNGKELRVLRLLGEGYSNQAMADKLLVSESTVRSHLRRIHSKLGVRSRLQAVATARALGLLR